MVHHQDAQIVDVNAEVEMETDSLPTTKNCNLGFVTNSQIKQIKVKYNFHVIDRYHYTGDRV